MNARQLDPEALGDRLHAPPDELARLSADDQRALRDILQRAIES